MVDNLELPTNYTLNSVLLEDFENLSQWAVATADVNYASISADTTNIFSGTQSLKLTVTSGIRMAVRIMDEDFSGKWKVSFFRFYIEDLASLSYMEIIIGASSTKNFSITATGTYPNLQLNGITLKQGWNFIPVLAEDWTVIGGFKQTDRVKRIYLKIQQRSASGIPASVSFDGFYYDHKGFSRCIITFDDTWDSMFTKAYPIMESRKIPGTVYHTSGLTGSAGITTTDHLDALYANGWDICSHASTHINLSELSVAEVEDNVGESMEWLLNRGYKRSYRHFAEPFGHSSENIKTALSNLGVLTARQGNKRPIFLPTFDMYQVRAFSVFPTHTIQDWKDFVDTCLNTDACFCVIVHGLTDWGTPDILESLFLDMMDYLVERKVKCVTMSEWYEGITNPRYRTFSLNR